MKPKLFSFLHVGPEINSLAALAPSCSLSLRQLANLSSSKSRFSEFGQEII